MREVDHISLRRYLKSERSIDDVLQLFEMSADEMWAGSIATEDQIYFNSTSDVFVRIADSVIHGRGIFASRDLKKGEILAPARLSGKRTPAGRYCNHSPKENSVMVMVGNGDVYLMATADIGKDEEVLNDYCFNYLNTRSKR